MSIYINKGVETDKEWNLFLVYVNIIKSFNGIKSDVYSDFINKNKHEFYKLIDKREWLFCWQHKKISLLDDLLFINSFKLLERFMIEKVWISDKTSYFQKAINTFSISDTLVTNEENIITVPRSLCVKCKYGKSCDYLSCDGHDGHDDANKCDMRFRCDYISGIHLCGKHCSINNIITLKNGVKINPVQIMDERKNVPQNMLNIRKVKKVKKVKKIKH